MRLTPQVDPPAGRAYRVDMEPGSLRRRTLALVAAYAVALQVVLPGFLPMSAMVAADTFVTICSHESGDGPAQPANHDLPCTALCAAMAQASPGPLPVAVAHAPARTQVLAALAPAVDWVAPRIAPAETHAPRGPPVG